MLVAILRISSVFYCQIAWAYDGWQLMLVLARRRCKFQATQFSKFTPHWRYLLSVQDSTVQDLSQDTYNPCALRSLPRRWFSRTKLRYPKVESCPSRYNVVTYPRRYECQTSATTMWQAVRKQIARFSFIMEHRSKANGHATTHILKSTTSPKPHLGFYAKV